MTLIIAIVALLIGAAFCFAGFRFFLILLPIWAFVVGFNVGMDAIAAIFGDGTFATVTSWVVGLIVAFGFAIFSYLFYYAAIAIVAGAVGYAIGAGVWGIIGNEYGLIAFVIGIICAAIVAVGALALNVPKYLVVGLTALGGAATVIAGWFILIGKVPSDAIQWTTVGQLIKDSWFYLIVLAFLAGAGFLAQLRAPSLGPSTYELDRTTYRYS